MIAYNCKVSLSTRPCNLRRVEGPDSIHSLDNLIMKDQTKLAVNPVLQMPVGALLL